MKKLSSICALVILLACVQVAFAQGGGACVWITEGATLHCGQCGNLDTVVTSRCLGMATAWHCLQSYGTCCGRGYTIANYSSVNNEGCKGGGGGLSIEAREKLDAETDPYILSRVLVPSCSGSLFPLRSRTLDEKVLPEI